MTALPILLANPVTTECVPFPTPLTVPTVPLTTLEGIFLIERFPEIYFPVWFTTELAISTVPSATPDTLFPAASATAIGSLPTAVTVCPKALRTRPPLSAFLLGFLGLF